MGESGGRLHLARNIDSVDGLGPVAVGMATVITESPQRNQPIIMPDLGSLLSVSPVLCTGPLLVIDCIVAVTSPRATSLPVGL